MADIELVIKIPEEIYNSACAANNIWDMRMAGFVCSAIANGIPLPKGHGELVDRDVVNERYDAIYRDAMNCSNRPSDKYLLDKWSMCLDAALIIIEADKESE